jgi:hypothetical protein
MGRANELLTNFTAGELSPRLDVRTDINKYRNGAKTLRNAIVLAHGGATKRPGTMHVLPCYDPTFASRIERFEYSTEQAYQIEFAPGYLRFFKDRGVITGTAITITAATKANPCVITYTGADPANGDKILITGVGGMTQLNNRVFTVANVNAGANTLELSGVNSSAYDTYTSGGSAASPVQVAHTYTNQQIDELWVTQSANTMYIFHPSHPIRKLTRSSHTSWTLTDMAPRQGPFRGVNGDTTHYLFPAVYDTDGTTPYFTASVSAVTKANPAVVTTSAPHDFGEGTAVRFTSVGGMTQLNNNTYIARNVTATTFELWTAAEQKVNSSAFTTYTSGGTAAIDGVSSMITPGSKCKVFSTKSLFTANHVGALFRLWEPGAASGVATPVAGAAVQLNDQYTFDGKVYLVGAIQTATTWQAAWNYPSHDRGVVRVADTSGTNVILSAYVHDSSCVLQIISYTSPTEVVARVVHNHVPTSVANLTARQGTSIWEQGAWSIDNGYPRVGTLHNARLFGFSSLADPQFLWGSVVSDFENLQDGANDDLAVIEQMVSDKVEVARWAVSMPQALVIGTAGSVQSVFGSLTGDTRGITPSNISIKAQLSQGVTSMRPIRVGSSLFYGERNGALANPARVINELSYVSDGDGFIAPPATIISEHITGAGVTEGAFQVTPLAVAWFRRTDGRLAGLTYEPGQEVRAWHLHELGGETADYDHAEVKHLSSLPGAEGDETWFVVKRRINSADVHYIEFLTTGLTPTKEKEDCVYLDSALTYDGSSTSTISGLNHLEGQTVYALVDGAKQGPFTVTTGEITLTAPGELIHVGLRYLSVVESIDLDAAAQFGTAKTRAKLINTVWPFFERSLGGRMGPSSDLMYDILFRTDSDLFGTSPALKTDFVEHDVAGGWSRRAYMRFEHDEPYPFTLLGIAAEISTSG